MKIIDGAAFGISVALPSARETAIEIVDEQTSALLKYMAENGWEVEPSPDGMVPRLCETPTKEVRVFHVSRDWLIESAEAHLLVDRFNGPRFTGEPVG